LFLEQLNELKIDQLLKLVINYLSKICLTMNGIENKLQNDSIYKESDLLEMQMKPLNGHKMDYITFEKDNRIYFFERVNNNLLRLFCSTSRKSFYFS